MHWDLTDLAICALAVNQTVEVWHHSELFERKRESITQWLDAHSTVETAAPFRLSVELQWWWHKVRMCPWCFSVPLGLAVVSYIELVNHAGQFTPWLLLPVYGLAISRVANLINDTLHAYLRTPRTYGSVITDDTPHDEPA